MIRWSWMRWRYLPHLMHCSSLAEPYPLQAVIPQSCLHSRNHRTIACMKRRGIVLAGRSFRSASMSLCVVQRFRNPLAAVSAVRLPVGRWSAISELKDVFARCHPCPIFIFCPATEFTLRGQSRSSPAEELRRPPRQILVVR